MFELFDAFGYFLVVLFMTRATVGDGRFVTLVLVKKTGDSRGNSAAEKIWSDLFSWISYEWGQERCMDWYKKQPNPKIYTGKRTAGLSSRDYVVVCCIEGKGCFLEGYTL